VWWRHGAVRHRVVHVGWCVDVLLHLVIKLLPLPKVLGQPLLSKPRDSLFMGSGGPGLSAGCLLLVVHATAGVCACEAIEGSRIFRQRRPVATARCFRYSCRVIGVIGLHRNNSTGLWIEMIGSRHMSDRSDRIDRGDRLSSDRSDRLA